MDLDNLKSWVTKVNDAGVNSPTLDSYNLMRIAECLEKMVELKKLELGATKREDVE